MQKVSQGDEEARQMLIEHNMRLVVHIARKYKVPGSTFDDLISIGSVGLIKAIRSFDLHTGTPLSTYAARCIEKPMHPQRLELGRRAGSAFRGAAPSGTPLPFSS